MTIKQLAKRQPVSSHPELGDFIEITTEERDALVAETARLTADLATANAKNAQLREALKLHHQWHLDQRDRSPVYFGDTTGQVNGDEYAESELCEKTTAALAPAQKEAE